MVNHKYVSFMIFHAFLNIPLLSNYIYNTLGLNRQGITFSYSRTRWTTHVLWLLETAQVALAGSAARILFFILSLYFSSSKSNKHIVFNDLWEANGITCRKQGVLDRQTSRLEDWFQTQDFQPKAIIKAFNEVCTLYKSMIMTMFRSAPVISLLMINVINSSDKIYIFYHQLRHNS